MIAKQMHLWAYFLKNGKGTAMAGLTLFSLI